MAATISCPWRQAACCKKVFTGGERCVTALEEEKKRKYHGEEVTGDAGCVMAAEKTRCEGGNGKRGEENLPRGRCWTRCAVVLDGLCGRGAVRQCVDACTAAVELTTATRIACTELCGGGDVLCALEENEAERRRFECGKGEKYLLPPI